MYNCITNSSKLFYMIGSKSNLYSFALIVSVLISVTFLNYMQSFKLIYHLQQPLFLVSASSFFNAFNTPGGFINYISQFACELYALNGLNVILVSLIIGGISLLVYNLSKQGIGKKLAFIVSLALIPVQLLLISNYIFKIESLLIILSALCFARISIILIDNVKYALLLAILIIVNSLFAYIIASGLALILLSAIILPKLLTSNKKSSILLSLLIITLCIVIPYAGVILKYETTTLFDSYLSHIIKNKYYKSPTPYFIFIGLIVIILYTSTLTKKPIKIKNSIFFSLAFLIILTSFVLPQSQINHDKKTQINIDYLASIKDWNKVKQLANNENTKVRLNAFHYNRSLYYTNSLLSDACSHPQYFGNESLLVEREINSSILIYASDIYYDLGFINEARHWAHEAFTIFGEQPRILKRLVQVNIINGKYNAAKKYILKLKKSVLHKEWATEQEHFLYNEDLINSNKEYKEKRVYSPTEDFFTRRLTPWENLTELLKKDSNNKMAFEYLVANYLLRHELIHVIKLVPEFKRLGYKELPKLVQECVLLYMVKTNKQSIQLSGYQFDSKTMNRIKEYSQLYMKYKKDDRKAKQQLDKKFADSYWYYIHFISPITNKRK